MKAALLLAAGMSSRFPGTNKLLLEYRNRPLIGWAAEAFGLAPVDKRILVTGRDRALITQAVATYCAAPFEILHNDAPETGFADSLKLGLGATAAANWTLLLLGDMPEIDGALLQDLFAAAEPDAYAIVPSLAGAQLTAQWLWFGPNSPPPCPAQGVSASQGLAITIQP